MSESPRTLIDELLREQQCLTAVDQFSRRHDRHELPAQARYYRDLIPLQKPRHGEQYAFAVDLDACTGCKACVSACHSLNGLEDEELWRNVGLLHGGTRSQPYQQTITTACHHCADPACANGCPVLAYEKDEETGVVRHLDDQCIGCQYCVLKCPYDVPKYSKAKGIVRKCDMCHGRLAQGEAPACVQACPTQAIRIEVVSMSEMLSPLRPPIIPGAFDSSYTGPTTRYITNREMPDNARPADREALRLEDPHTPLAVMLILTQIAAGLHLFHAIAALAGVSMAPLWSALIACGMLVSGMLVSFSHLGRPLKAWRAVLGLRRSWMSREIAAFSLYAGIASLLVLLPGNAFIAAATSLVALASVFCSAMIYVDTRRPFWAASRTFLNFFGTTLLLGSSGMAAICGFLAPPCAWAYGSTALVVRSLLALMEARAHFRALTDENAPAHRSAWIIQKRLGGIMLARAVLFVVSTLLACLAVGDYANLGGEWALLSFLSTLCSQMLERHVFFRAAAAPRMPGGIFA